LGFHYAVFFIAETHQLRLRPYAHSPDLADRQRHHARMLVTERGLREAKDFNMGITEFQLYELFAPQNQAGLFWGKTGNVENY
jgi:hypothetical protein